MILITVQILSIPLKNPVLIFSVILFIILFAPIILDKLKIPHLIGLIIAGALVGPNGFGFLLRDSSIELFGTVGLLYIMFLAGLEIDLNDFKKNSGKSVVFGMYTFILPMLFGTLAGIYILKFSLLASVLLASMFASHTLITYPIVSKLGITKNRAVNITIGGTFITVLLALLVLAIVIKMSTGVIDNGFWIQLGLSIVVFGLVVVLGFPFVGRWFFKNYDEKVLQYIFVLGLVFLGSFFAELAGIDKIIGAFLVGFALNRLIPRTSALMNRIDFIGNALFIPFFLIGVGMLVNFRAFISDWKTILVAVTMSVIATSTKYVAAWLTQKSFRFTIDERRLIFGLSNAQAASTLAAVLVGYNTILGIAENGEPIRLLNENVLNGTILMILVTCTIASFATQRGAQNVAIQEDHEEEDQKTTFQEKTLIPLSNPETIEELISLSVTINHKKIGYGLYALKIINSETTNTVAAKKAKELLHKAALAASATDHELNQLVRYDLNVINGITNVIKEYEINTLVMGLHHKKSITDSFLGNMTDGILSKCDTTTLIYRSIQPLNTIKRHIVIIPENAEKESGFLHWLTKVWNISANTGARLVFFASEQTILTIQSLQKDYPTGVDFNVFSDWRDFLILSRDIKENDNLFIVLSRKGNISYNSSMQKIPTFLNKYFKSNSCILIYPAQTISSEEITLMHKNISVLEPLKEGLWAVEGMVDKFTKLFRKD